MAERMFEAVAGKGRQRTAHNRSGEEAAPHPDVTGRLKSTNPWGVGFLECPEVPAQPGNHTPGGQPQFNMRAGLHIQNQPKMWL